MQDLTQNKRIAKNTIMLYIRMIIVLAVNLYSSRIVLQELGAEDYGIYNIVGGIVALFAFLNTTMSGATSRFLTFALGENNLTKLKSTFSSSITLHFIIALIILLLSETIGLWIVNKKLVIPETKLYAANIIFQLSILTIIIKTIQVPFNASIIAHEKMNIYAYVEISNAIITIVFLFSLQAFSNGKLIIYGAMILFIAICILITYILYCKRHFQECQAGPSYNWQIIKPMLSFSCFDLYGNMCVAARTQGTNIILNIFFGTIINAANGIATQVQAALLMISHNITLAFRPQIIKNYASNHIDLMCNQINNSTIISSLLFSLFAVPLILEMPYVLDLWLKTPPDHTINITRITIISCFLGSINSILIIPIHASGKIKKLSLYNGSIYLLSLPTIYYIISVWTIPEIAYCIMVVFMLFLLSSTCIILKQNIPEFPISNYWIKTMLPTVICICISAFISYLIKPLLGEGFFRLICIFCVNFVVLIITSNFFLLNSRQRLELKHNILKTINIQKK